MLLNTGSEKLLLENLSTALLVLDAKLRITYVNHAAQAFLEQSHNRLLAFPLGQFLQNASIDLQRLEETLRTGEGFSDSEVQVAFVDGRYLLADVTVTCIDQSGARALLLEIRKIDQQKRISQESQQWAQQQAARDLIRGLAHEIKNPLGGIRGAAQLLEKELDGEDKKEFTQMIIEQSDRLRKLVDRLLGPNALPNQHWQNVHRVMEKVRSLVGVETDYAIEIFRDYDPSIPDLWIDADMMLQAILNIVRNSVQAIQETDIKGRIELSTRIERRMTIHGKLYPLVAQIKIVDNGPGIPEGIKDTLFYPMVTGKKDGTGLGLSIAQQLVDHHKGKIEVDSWPGHTEFTLYIPIDKKEPI